jgi:penicillin-binding protein 1A
MGLVALGLVAGLVALLLAPALFAVGAGAHQAVQVYRDTAVPKTPSLPRTTFVYDRDGNLLTTLHGAVNRIPIPLSDIPQSMRRAAIAAEDENFYQEQGVSIPAIIRAAWVNIIHHEVLQGGSTITQQYVKDVYTGDERTLARKVREAIIAQKLSRKYSKNAILAKYLNEVYFGQGAYGVQTAAQAYFGKNARQLNVLQSATLAALIAAPAIFDPITHPQQAMDRRNWVLGRMVSLGYMGPKKADALKARPVHTSPPAAAPIPAQYFLSYVTQTLEKRLGNAATFGGGLHVRTTLDLHLQRLARTAVDSHLSTPGDPSAALVAMDPRTGEVLAMVGGRSHDKVKFNLATQAHRQAGSAFKPFTLTTAISQGISLLSRWNGPPSLTIDDPRCYTTDPTTGVYGPWDVHNYADESAGTMSLLDATANSVNTIFSQVVLDVGPDNIVTMAHRMGIRSPLQPVCSITLGTQAVTPLEMTDGYATLASRGVRRWPEPIQEVQAPSGKVVMQPKGDPKRVLPQKVADLVTYALEGVIQHGTGTAANIGRPEAGKTGTAENFQDAWFCGYTPQLATCVWVGYPKGEIPMLNVEGFPEVFGGSIPALIWHDFMQKALAGVPPQDFPTPDLSGYDVNPSHAVVPPPPPAPAPSPTGRGGGHGGGGVHGGGGHGGGGGGEGGGGGGGTG